jgi:hypothetical protein
MTMIVPPLKGAPAGPSEATHPAYAVTASGPYTDSSVPPTVWSLALVRAAIYDATMCKQGTATIDGATVRWTHDGLSAVFTAAPVTLPTPAAECVRCGQWETEHRTPSNASCCVEGFEAAPEPGTPDNPFCVHCTLPYVHHRHALTAGCDDFADDGGSHPLVADLRRALRDWFHDYERPLPDAVSFDVIDDGPAYKACDPTLHYGDRTKVFGDHFEGTTVADALTEINEERPPASTDGPLTVRFRPALKPQQATAPDLGDPVPGMEYIYPLSDYARETARVLSKDGEAWGAESGFLGASGLIYTSDGRELRLWVDADEDLMLSDEDPSNSDVHVPTVEAPAGAPRTPAELRAWAQCIAATVRDHYGT